MMRQYLDVKEANPDCVLLYRVGDFYEMFFEDALNISKELELTLTGKDCGLEERAPMCGVPFHAVDVYIEKLVENGHKVAICEQLEDPKDAKGLVERGIIRIVTPGTASNETDETVYIMAIKKQYGKIGVSYADVSTGEFRVAEFENEDELKNLIIRIAPREFLISEGEAFNIDFGSTTVSKYFPYAFEEGNASSFLLEHFKVADLSIYGTDGMNAGICASGALLRYLYETQKNMLVHITKLTPENDGNYMVIDPATKRNLELTLTLRERKKKGSLLQLLDRTKTSMGARLLRTWIDQPLTNIKLINRRLTAVSELNSDYQLRYELSEAMDGVFDIERLLSRISYGSLDARHALSLKRSASKFKDIIKALENTKSELLREIYNGIDPLTELCAYLENAVAEDPPVGIRDGGIIKDGFNTEVDKLRNTGTNAKDYIARLEQREREKTGLKNLRIGYNRVFGYYIEVPRSQSASVPYEYVRKQTLANAERYITQELKELEDTVNGAEEKLKKLEEEIFISIRSRISDNIEKLQKNSALIALADVLYSLAQVAYDNNYVKPKMSEDGEIEIKGGRHPVVERSISVRHDFVPNDAYLNNTDNRIMVITGPNMGGKSTFMRQTALIVLMAHIGSFVPAQSAKICIVDRIFTRVGASDDLASGQSTFMVEMNELAGILMNATEKSLLILDEIGRGTSTQDGLAIAWATIEHIANNVKKGMKTLFATHFHELTDLEGNMDGVVNYSVGVKEYENSVIFLHRIKRGGADRSFGIEVARLAGLPEKLLKRSKALLNTIENNSNIRLSSLEITEEEENKRDENAIRILSELRTIDINKLTPMEAMVILDDLKRKAEAQ